MAENLHQKNISPPALVGEILFREFFVLCNDYIEDMVGDLYSIGENLFHQI